MPISRSEFESGELDPSVLLIEFLRSNPDNAYTLGDLTSELVSKGVNLTEGEMQEILRLLESRGRIESKIIYDVIYYIYRTTIGFRPS